MQRSGQSSPASNVFASIYNQSRETDYKILHDLDKFMKLFSGCEEVHVSEE